ncbi:hypothetical protein [Almyronema epifaneia]|uniref:Uncharacterized protein n=1 Tax=Almyronema epifaneia S1 TaxID=2991925 RepID=A0ABW6IAP3_9CYAN
MAAESASQIDGAAASLQSEAAINKIFARLSQGDRLSQINWQAKSEALSTV